jgi:hypothetical protein
MRLGFSNLDTQNLVNRPYKFSATDLWELKDKGVGEIEIKSLYPRISL